VAFVENHDGNTNTDPSVPGYGTAILIRHVDGTVAAYDHLKYKSTKVVKDQYVFQGEIIALSGNTGHSSAPHLHFDLRMFWNNANDFGPTVPVQFEDKNHVSWRPKNGDPLASNNSVLRQEEWRWCSKCHGLYFSGKPSIGTTEGKCPAGGTHSHAGSANYLLVLNSNVPGQADWRWCSKCQGLFFAGSPGSKCPAGVYTLIRVANTTKMALARLVSISKGILKIFSPSQRPSTVQKGQLHTIVLLGDPDSESSDNGPGARAAPQIASNGVDEQEPRMDRERLSRHPA
jgi:hypothetical protein